MNENQIPEINDQAVEEQTAPEQTAPEQTAPEQVVEEPVAAEQAAAEPAADQATEQAAPEQPTYEQPTYEQPTYQQPVYQQPVYQQPVYVQAPANAKSKIAAGLLGIFLGALGIHNFYLGYTGKAIAQLLMSVLSCGFLAVASEIWGLVEGIMILTSPNPTDAQGNPLV